MATHMVQRRPAFVLMLAGLALIGACKRDKPAEDPAANTPKRQKLILEIDQMASTPQVPTKITVRGKEVRLEDIFKDVGIDVVVRRDRMDLPRTDAVTLGNLHDLMLAHRNARNVASDEIGVHVVVATREVGRPRDLGIMFDYGDTDTDNYPREGFAVFADVHERLPGGRDPEMMLTLAHELTHVLNLHHADWEPAAPDGSFDRGSTIESYSGADTVKWALSDRSKQHLLADPPREKWPGRDNLAFGFLIQEHFKRHQPEPNDPTLKVIEVSGLSEKGRHARVAVEQAARKYPRDRSAIIDAAGSPLRLKVEVPRTTYEIGEPLTVTVGLHNTGKTPLYVRPLLDPSYGFLNIEIQLPGSGVFLPFQSVVTREARAVPELLAAGGQRHDEAKVFFGAGGWTFQRPGTYRIRADFPAPGATAAETLTTKRRIQSETVELIVVTPRTEAGRRTSALLAGMQEGLSLVIGSSSAQLERAAATGEASPQAAAARLAIIQEAANPTPGKTSVPLDQALKYLPQTTAAASGPFSMAQTYDLLADALEQKGKKIEAMNVRRQLKTRLAKVDGGAEAMQRIGPPK